MTRVALVTAHFPPRLSGHGDFTARLSQSLHELGMHIDVVVLGQDSVEALPGIEVHHAPFPSGPRSLLAATNIICDLKADVVCLQFEAHAFRLQAVPHLMPAVLRARGMYVAMTYHELWAPKRFGRVAKALLLNAPQRAIVFSRWHAEGVDRFRKFGLPSEPIAVSTNILAPIGDSRLLRVRYGLETTTVITFFGFVITAHCIDELIMSVAKLRADGRDIALSVIGRFDPVVDGYHQQLVDLSERLGIRDAITWHGRVASDTDVARLLALTDIGVLPYDSGVGENNGAFAALAQYGVPTVTTRGDRSVEMEAEGVAKFAAPTADSLAEAIRSLLDDQQQRTALGARARRWSERRSWAAVARSYQTVLERGPRQEIT